MQKTLVMGLLTIFIAGGCATLDTGKEVKVTGGSYRSISPAQLAEMLKSKDFFLVNVHVPYAGEIERTDALISYTDTYVRIGEYPGEKSAKIVVYCLTNYMSGIAARDLVLKGYRNVYLLDGGMKGWQKAGFTLMYKTDQN